MKSLYCLIVTSKLVSRPLNSAKEKEEEMQCELFDPLSCLQLGFCMFVLSLVKKHYRLQFYMVRGVGSVCVWGYECAFYVCEREIEIDFLIHLKICRD